MQALASLTQKLICSSGDREFLAPCNCASSQSTLSSSINTESFNDLWLGIIKLIESHSLNKRVFIKDFLFKHVRGR